MQGSRVGGPAGRSTRRLSRMYPITEMEDRQRVHWAGEQQYVAIVGRSRAAYPGVKVEPELPGLDLDLVGIPKAGERREVDLTVQYCGLTWI